MNNNHHVIQFEIVFVGKSPFINENRVYYSTFLSHLSNKCEGLLAVNAYPTEIGLKNRWVEIVSN